MIPSTPKEETDNDSSSSEAADSTDKKHLSKDGCKKKQAPVIPVMRRHGEPLMIMPEWQKEQERHFKARRPVHEEKE